MTAVEREQVRHLYTRHENSLISQISPISLKSNSSFKHYICHISYIKIGEIGKNGKIVDLSTCGIVMLTTQTKRSAKFVRRITPYFIANRHSTISAA